MEINLELSYLFGICLRFEIYSIILSNQLLLTMDDLPRILYELDGQYPYINQTLVNEPGLYVEMDTKTIYNTFTAEGEPELVYRWVLDKQVELFREGVGVAVFNKHDLEDGQVRVIFAAQFPDKDEAA